MERVYNLHQMDLAKKYDGAFMFDRLEIKYKNAGKEFIWQWFFPAKTLTYVKESKEHRPISGPCLTSSTPDSWGTQPSLNPLPSPSNPSPQATAD